ncbi:MAG: HAMP domain-containing protein [Alcanivorax sp.]
MFAKFNRINIKYGAAFIGVALALLVVVTANALLVNSVKERMLEVTSTLNRAISLVLNADRDLYQARLAEMAYLRGIPGTPQAQAQIASYEENAAQARERIQQVAGLMANYGDVSESVGKFEGLYERWREESGRSIQMYADEDIGGAMEQIDGASRDSFEQLRTFYDATGQAVDQRVQELEAVTMAQVRRQQTLVIGFAVVVGLVAIAIALIGPHLMSKAIRQVSARIREITDGDGDLTARIQSHRGDEIGDLAEQFNRFIQAGAVPSWRGCCARHRVFVSAGGCRQQTTTGRNGRSEQHTQLVFGTSPMGDLCSSFTARKGV